MFLARRAIIWELQENRSSLMDRPIESVEFGDLVSHSRNQENSVENSGHSRQNQENLKIYDIQNESGMHSETFHSSDEDLKIQFEEIGLKNDDDDLIQKKSQSDE